MMERHFGEQFHILSVSLSRLDPYSDYRDFVLALTIEDPDSFDAGWDVGFEFLDGRWKIVQIGKRIA